MKKYRHLPTVIDAQQWWPPGDARHDPAMLSHRRGNGVSPPDYLRAGDIFQFSTIKGMGDDIFMLRLASGTGTVKIAPGDWIITGVNGEKYPCAADVFEKNYELEEQP